MSSPSSTRRSKDIFLAAHIISDAAERARFLKQACGEDAELLQRVQALLDADAGAEGFLDSATPDEPTPGDKVGYFGDYVLLDEIARGSSGVVFRARQVSLDRVVALKMLKDGPLMTNDADVQRLRAEAKAAASLDHPNILPIYEVGAHEEQPYFSMKLVTGGTLQFRMAEYQQDVRKAVALLVKVARAMQHAHSQGILHRDLKPGNILIDGNGEPHIADFGLARKIGLDSSLTMTGQMMGTPLYMSPEQARGSAKELTPATDIYSLGTILYELIEGRRPFHSDDLLDLIKQVAEKPAPAPQTAHRGLATIAMKCLEKSPAARYATAGELADALEGWLRGDPVSTRTSSARRIPWKPTLAVAAVILLAVGGKMLWDFQHGIDSHQTVTPVIVSSTPVHTFAGHRYQFVLGEVRWEEAKAKAEAMGGHLATVTSKEENEFIYATFGDKLNPAMRASSIWIGGFADDMGQSFKWVTGEPFAFTDWSAGEPDYSGTSGEPQPGTFGMVIKHHGKLGWFDDPVKRDNSKAGFIVERDDDGVRKSVPSASAAVDLLALADVVKDAEGGTWRREGTDLIVAEDPTKPRVKGSGTRLSLALPVRVKGSYRMEVEFTKHGPKEAVSVLLPLADGRSVVANFQESADLAGLWSVRGLTVKDAANPTRTPHRLENERRYQAAVQVLLKGDQADITATVEDKPLFRFQGPVADLDSRQFALADQARPGIKSMDPVTWHSVRIIPLDGGTLTPARTGVTLPATSP